MFCHMINDCLGYREVGGRKCFSLQLCQFQKTYRPQFSIQHPHSFPVSRFYLHYVFPFPFSRFFMLLLFLPLILIHYSYIPFSSPTCVPYCLLLFLFYFFHFICLTFIQFLQLYPTITFYSIVALFCTCFFIFIFFCLGTETLSHYPDQACLNLLISLLCLVCVRMLACPTLGKFHSSLLIVTGYGIFQFLIL